MLIKERKALIVWVTDPKAARNLDRFGSLHYISKRMKYAVLYIDAAKEEEVKTQLSRLHYVKQIEPSFRGEIKTEYEGKLPDKTRFYSY